MNRTDIIIIAGGTWRERWTTYQPVADGLRRCFRVLYVEANYSFGKAFKSLRREPYPLTLRGRLRRIDDGFALLTPPPRLPFRHYCRSIGMLNQIILRGSIRREAGRLGLREPILWTFLHQSDRLVGGLNESLAVYHCVDYWPWLLPKVRFMGCPRVIERDERLTASKVDFTVSTSRFLQRRMEKINPHSYLVRNAADVELFSNALRDDLPVPEDIRRITHPILGFSGSLEAKSDLDLLRRIALENPSWNLVFIGLTENVPDIDKIRALPNTHFLGLKPVRELPLYFRRFEVCLVPFRKTPELESISPLKIFEYLAASRPVVATRYKEIADLEEVVYLSDTTDEFLSNIKRALSEDSEILRHKRLAVARLNTWSKRTEQLEVLIRDHMQNRSVRQVYGS
jgi:glycosyltransferase involved in cell wall biosynthesis